VANRRLSVAMCTFQGEQYLEHQLDSIAWQTRPPDELVVCDDGSTDGTVAILRRFQSRAAFPVRLHVNDKRLGFTKNFEKAIVLCEGDLIFLADQDDVWNSSKLAVLLDTFVAASSIGAVFSNADVVDEEGVPLGYSLWDSVGFTPPLRRRFTRDRAVDVLLKQNVVSGMTLAFRARFRDLIVPFPPGWFHDCWIPLLIAAVTDVTIVPLRLVKYRKHEGQELGLPRNFVHKIAEKRKTGARALLHEADQYEAAHQRLITNTSFSCSPDVLCRLEAKIDHIRTRARIRSGRGNLTLPLRELAALNYHRYANGWKSVAADMLLPKLSFGL
jgi:glycosyltransferase involved in cell wall biosynthesis